MSAYLAAARGVSPGARVRIRTGCSCAGSVFTVTEVVARPGEVDPRCVQIFGDAGLGPVRLTELELCPEGAR
jgi:hypothetical protein